MKSFLRPPANTGNNTIELASIAMKSTKRSGLEKKHSKDDRTKTRQPELSATMERNLKNQHGPNSAVKSANTLQVNHAFNVEHGKSHFGQPKVHKLKQPEHNSLNDIEKYERKEGIGSDISSISSDDTDSEEERLMDSLELSISISPKPRVKKHNTFKQAIKKDKKKENSLDGQHISSQKQEESILFQVHETKPISNQTSRDCIQSAPIISTNSLHQPARFQLDAIDKSHELHSSLQIATSRKVTTPIPSTAADSRTQVKHTGAEKKKPPKDEIGREISSHQQKVNSISKQAESKAIKNEANRRPDSNSCPSHGTVDEEEQLRQEILSLNTKLEKTRKAKSSCDSPRINTIETDIECEELPSKSSTSKPLESLDVDMNVTAYGGGVHHKLGTRTSSNDRCSLEKRMQMSGVHKTRVRKGPQVHTLDEKPEVKKADKVVVKKDLAFMMLLS